jgi:mono/diheme cytochrome c family protein
MAYKFLIQGSTAPAADGRTALLLEEPERDMVLAEMRAFLASVQGIIQAAGSGDMEAVAAHARGVGMAAGDAVPATLVGKLPLAFKKLGFGTHRSFDQLALDAEQLGDPQHAMEQLAELMGNCIACHAAYRIDTAKP